MKLSRNEHPVGTTGFYGRPWRTTAKTTLRPVKVVLVETSTGEKRWQTIRNGTLLYRDDVWETKEEAAAPENEDRFQPFPPSA